MSSLASRRKFLALAGSTALCAPLVLRRAYGSVVLTPSGIDDTLAIQAALATEKVVRLTDGQFFATGDLMPQLQGQKFRGEGPGATVLTITTPDRPGVPFSGWLNDVEISGMTIDRSVPATAGGVGLTTQAVSCNYALLENLKLRGHHLGLDLGVTGWSHARHIVIEQCVTDGLRLSNGVAAGTLQWQLDDIYSARNGGRGFLAVTLPGSAQCTMGNWSKVSTWANTGCGAAFVGSAAVPLHGVRIHDAFFGEDGNHEMLFDTYGGLHELTKVFCELAGRRTTGPTLSTPVSGVGNGIYYSANNSGLTIVGGRLAGNSQRGLLADAGGSLLVVGVTAQGNTSGSYKLGSANQMLRECRNNAGGLVNVAGPVTVA